MLQVTEILSSLFLNFILDSENAHYWTICIILLPLLDSRNLGFFWLFFSSKASAFTHSFSTK